MGTAKMLRVPPGYTRDAPEPTSAIIVRGDLDAAAASEVVALLDRRGPRGRVEVVLDLSDVGFADAQGLELLVRARGRLVALGGDLRTIGASGGVRRLLAVCGLADLDTPREASSSETGMSAPVAQAG